MEQTPTKITLAAAHVGEAIRLLRSIDKQRFEHITRSLQPYVRQIEKLKEDTRGTA